MAYNKKKRYFYDHAHTYLYYHQDSTNSPCQREILTQSNEASNSNLSSPSGFQVEWKWQDNVCHGFLSFHGEKPVYVDRLELVYTNESFKQPTYLSPNPPPLSAFHLLQNQPHWFYGEAYHKKTKDKNNQAQILFAPAAMGNQLLQFVIEYKQRLLLSKQKQRADNELFSSHKKRKVKSIRVQWLFAKQLFFPHSYYSVNKQSLVPFTIIDQVRVHKQRKKQTKLFDHSYNEELRQHLDVSQRQKKLGTQCITVPLEVPKSKEAGLDIAKAMPTSHISSILQEIGKYAQGAGIFVIYPKIPNLVGHASYAEQYRHLIEASKQIRAHKMQAGLHFSPFVALPHSQIVSKQPHLFLKTNNKFVLTRIQDIPNQDLYVFDLSHPNYLKWLQHNIHTIIKKWKFSYVNLLGLEAGWLSGDAYNPSQTVVQRLNQALGLLAKTAGKKVFLSAPAACLSWPSLAFLDVLEMSPAAQNPSMKATAMVSKNAFVKNLAVLLGNLHLQACFYNYKQPTYKLSIDKYLQSFQQKYLDKRQLRLLYSIISLSGAAFSLNQNTSEISLWNHSDWPKILKLHLACQGNSYVPLRNEATWDKDGSIVGIYQSCGFLGVWNPTAKPKMIELSLPTSASLKSTLAMKSGDYWTGRTIPWHWQEDKISIGLAPFESFIAGPS